ncbi:MAG TPA: hypothetical protein ENF26_03900 [Methanomicrobia archaeon]|nr:hypothetical protein [Methanomicrobia archaeon]HEX59275.1 hypothetical protein [Methanomicrobia archaeon]
MVLVRLELTILINGKPSVTYFLFPELATAFKKFRGSSSEVREVPYSAAFEFCRRMVRIAGQNGHKVRVRGNFVHYIKLVERQEDMLRKLKTEGRITLMG